MGYLVFFMVFWAVCLAPGFIGLTYILSAVLKKHLTRSGVDGYTAMFVGAILTALIPFMNLPVYMVRFFHYADKRWNDFRFVFLFVTMGLFSGAINSWLICKDDTPQKGSIPQFSLSTLLLCVVIIGALLGMFLPE